MTSRSLWRSVPRGKFTPQVPMSPENAESLVIQVLEYTQSQQVLPGVGFNVEGDVELDGELSNVIQSPTTDHLGDSHPFPLLNVHFENIHGPLKTRKKKPYDCKISGVRLIFSDNACRLQGINILKHCKVILSVSVLCNLD